MSEDLILMISVLIKNVIVIISFTILAICFQKWWIVLFAILFFSSVTRKDEDSK